MFCFSSRGSTGTSWVTVIAAVVLAACTPAPGDRPALDDAGDVVTEDTVEAGGIDEVQASINYTLGIDIDLFTPIFAVSRISGWTAHCLEQYANNRLIRPRTDYIGPQHPQTLLPLDQR